MRSYQSHGRRFAALLGGLMLMSTFSALAGPAALAETAGVSDTATTAVHNCPPVVPAGTMRCHSLTLVRTAS